MTELEPWIKTRQLVIEYGRLELDKTFGRSPNLRITVSDWREVLLNCGDTMIHAGRMYDIVGRKIGFGLVEMTYVPHSLRK